MCRSLDRITIAPLLHHIMFKQNYNCTILCVVVQLVLLLHHIVFFPHNVPISFHYIMFSQVVQSYPYIKGMLAQTRVSFFTFVSDFICATICTTTDLRINKNGYILPNVLRVHDYESTLAYKNTWELYQRRPKDWSTIRRHKELVMHNFIFYSNKPSDTYLGVFRTPLSAFNL